jgi:hypothetical protein
MLSADAQAIIQAIHDVGYAQIGVLFALIFAVTWKG